MLSFLSHSLQLIMRQLFYYTLFIISRSMTLHHLANNYIHFTCSFACWNMNYSMCTWVYINNTKVIVISWLLSLIKRKQHITVYVTFKTKKKGKKERKKKKKRKKNPKTRFGNVLVWPVQNSACQMSAS